jgi:hypothetical protein
MSRPGKTWYVAFSLVTAVVFGAITALADTATFTALHERQWEIEIRPLPFWPLMGLWTGLIVWLQYYRVSCSIRRASRPKQRPYAAPFWNLQVELQIKVMAVFGLSMIPMALLGLVFGS